MIGTTASSEDFTDFRGKFNRAMESNRISKTDQLGKLQGALTGNAALRVPPDWNTSIDTAWATLKKPFGAPLYLLIYNLWI